MPGRRSSRPVAQESGRSRPRRGALLRNRPRAGAFEEQLGGGVAGYKVRQCERGAGHHRHEDARGQQPLARERPETRHHRGAGAAIEITSAFQSVGGFSTAGVAPVTRAFMATIAFEATKYKLG